MGVNFEFFLLFDNLRGLSWLAEMAYANGESIIKRTNEPMYEMAEVPDLLCDFSAGEVRGARPTCEQAKDRASLELWYLV
jgi:hypothetical protein